VSGVSRNRGGFVKCVAIQKRLGIPVLDHIKCVPCHQVMVRPQVADGEDCRQIRRVAANILNKHSKAVFPLRRHDCDSIKKNVDHT
jgi:hypothetical protein